jgi:CubicO group peptidase (beta-lactamase class C family)
MLKLIAALLFGSLAFASQAQLYFPPLIGSTWETKNPSELNWCEERIDSLYDFLEESESKAFIVLVDGKIVLEKYFGTFTQDSLWYWASAGKTLTAVMTGIAQEEGYLNINEPSSTYMGEGWTSCDAATENAITVRDQLAMTSGLDDATGDPYCTEPACLQCIAESGTRWAYHNAPYTLLDSVIEGATGINFNTYFNSRIRNRLGMDGFWLWIDYNHVYFSKARSMARFGLAMLNNSVWQNDTLLRDQQYMYDMIHPSQDINQSYGYLWWLNEGPSYMLPTSQFVFPGKPMADAPSDIYAAMGKNGQIINVVPSRNMVVVRMGNVPGESFFVPNFYNNDIWKKINRLECDQSSVSEEKEQLILYPTSASESITIGGLKSSDHIEVWDALGRNTPVQRNGNVLTWSSTLAPGVYNVQVKRAGNESRFLRFEIVR